MSAVTLTKKLDPLRCLVTIRHLTVTQPTYINQTITTAGISSSRRSEISRVQRLYLNIYICQ